MKLYVWHESLYDYSEGVMFAFAESVEQARELVLANCNYVGSDLLVEPTVYDSPIGFAVWGGG